MPALPNLSQLLAALPKALASAVVACVVGLGLLASADAAQEGYALVASLMEVVAVDSEEGEAVGVNLDEEADSDAEDPSGPQGIDGSVVEGRGGFLVYRIGDAEAVREDSAAESTVLVSSRSWSWHGARGPPGRVAA